MSDAQHKTDGEEPGESSPLFIDEPAPFGQPSLKDDVKMSDPPEADLKRKGSDVQGGDEVPGYLRGRMTANLLFAVTVCAVGSSFQFGYNIGVVNAPQQVVESWINGSHIRMFNTSLPSKGEIWSVTTIWSTTVAIFAIGGMIGGLMSGWLADRFGRKGGMMFNNIFALIAAALMGFSKIVDAFPLLVLGRLVIGFNAGLNSGLAPMYLVEIGPVNLRGSLGSTNQLMVTVGILISQILGLPYLLGNERLWPVLFGLTALPAIFQLALLPFCPETPKYNLIGKGNREQAEKDLIKLRQKEDVSAEMDMMQEESDQLKSVPRVLFGDMFSNVDLRWPLFLAVMMMLSQQLSGINVAMYYSKDIFINAGMSDSGAGYATIGMGALNVVVTIISMWLVDHPKFGRRTLHLAGLAGMAVCSVFLVVMLTAQTMGYGWATIFCVFFVFAFVASFATGPGAIPWFYVSELFTQGARGHANSVAVATNWTANFFVGWSFLILQDMMYQFSFLVFTGFLALFWIFTFKFVPETKGIPVEEIVQRFKTRKTV